MCFGFFVGGEKGSMEDIMYFSGGGKVEVVGEWRKHLEYFEGSLLFGGQFPRQIVEAKVSCF